MNNWTNVSQELEILNATLDQMDKLIAEHKATLAATKTVITVADLKSEKIGLLTDQTASM